MVLNKKGAEWKLKRGRAQEDSFLEALALEEVFFFFNQRQQDEKQRSFARNVARSC